MFSEKASKGRSNSNRQRRSGSKVETNGFDCAMRIQSPKVKQYDRSSMSKLGAEARGFLGLFKGSQGSRI